MPSSFTPASLLIIGFSLNLTGCAAVWTDSAGNRRVLGFVNQTSSPITAPPTETATNVGLMLYRSPSHQGISVGYNSESITVVPITHTAPANQTHESQP